MGRAQGEEEMATIRAEQRSEVARGMIWAIALILGVSLTAPCSASAEFRMQLGVRVPMRDKVELAADMWLPKAPGRYPSILLRTPYIKSAGEDGVPKLGQF